MNSKDPRRLRMDANSFEVMFAFLALTAVAGIVLPTDLAGRAPIGQLLGSWTYAWGLLLLLASSGVLIGLWRGRANIEVAGLVCLVAAILIQIIALWTQVGVSSIVSLFTFVAIAWACARRVLILLRLSIENQL